MHDLMKFKGIDHDEVLYHYTSCKSVQGILKSGIFFATKSSFLNDTNELAYILELVEMVISEVENAEYRHLLRLSIIETMEEFTQRNIYVLSFSTDPDSLTLWAEFGDKTGYNMAFDGKKLLDAIKENHPITLHGHIIYDKAYQLKILRNLLFVKIPDELNITFKDIMEEEIKSQNTEAFQELTTRFQQDISRLAIFFKQNEFKSEQEYRIAFENPSKQSLSFREKDGFLLPYIQIYVGKLPLLSITVAPKNHVDLAPAGMRAYLEYLGYDTTVYFSQLKLRY
ncbi:DUF2971 domain-containing protein [Sharpea azabuensis]